jgi:8-oxo-dGTP pyrophosphatase MutT (NUDIX family)
VSVGGAGERVNAPASPRPAATVVLLRDAADGIELFLVQRHRSIGFMGGMHVFPGGKVDLDDDLSVLAAHVVDPRPAQAHVWGDDVDRTAAFARAVAAIRETYEEAGVLLCAQPLPASSPEIRARLLAGEPFAAILDALAVQLRIDLLQPFSRWITPESEPVRFDTSFFLTRVPADQIAEHDRGEAIDALWTSPRAALDAVTGGSLRLAPPTQRTLEQLVDFSSVDAALRFASSRPPPLIMPIIRSAGDELMIFYPGDPEHPVRERAFPGPTRHVLRQRPSRGSG